MGDCSSCLSKCRDVKMDDCPFYEEESYDDRIKKLYEKLQANFTGSYMYGRSGEPRPWGTPLVQPIAFENVAEATNIIPDTIYNAVFTGAMRTYNFSTNTSTMTFVPVESPPEEIPLVGPLEALGSNPE
jgi:hypothetical protein